MRYYKDLLYIRFVFIDNKALPVFLSFQTSSLEKHKIVHENFLHLFSLDILDKVIKKLTTFQFLWFCETSLYTSFKKLLVQTLGTEKKVQKYFISEPILKIEHLKNQICTKWQNKPFFVYIRQNFFQLKSILRNFELQCSTLKLPPDLRYYIEKKISRYSSADLINIAAEIVQLILYVLNIYKSVVRKCIRYCYEDLKLEEDVSIHGSYLAFSFLLFVV